MALTPSLARILAFPEEFLCAPTSAISPGSRYNSGVPFRIRPFRKADFETLWRIDQACFDPQLAYSQRELAFYMRRPGSFTLVAETMDERFPENGKEPESPETLGFIVAESHRKSGHIITIDVVEKARRAGVGRALLQAAEGKLLHEGVSTVDLETPVNNAIAIRFYRQQGYFVEKSVAGYYSGMLDALVMSKDLHSVAM
jgi:ribosomal protein S18 acetylase RimI-like enzyme